MVTVSKGEMRQNKLKVDRLGRAVPTLDLRRKQLNREILAMEEKYLELKKAMDEAKIKSEEIPFPEVEKLVEIENVNRDQINIAGVILEEVSEVVFKKKEYSIFATPVSFDIYIKIQRQYLELKEKQESMEAALGLLNEELSITTQRINLFEKRLIPEFKGNIKYIRGRLEDNERSSVIVAKIAQAERVGGNDEFESA